MLHVLAPLHARTTGCVVCGLLHMPLNISAGSGTSHASFGKMHALDMHTAQSGRAWPSSCCCVGARFSNMLTSTSTSSTLDSACAMWCYLWWFGFRQHHGVTAL
jgi:hypothetical protein